jgi:hypothetical protein
MPSVVKVNIQSVNKGCGAARDMSVKNSDASFRENIIGKSQSKSRVVEDPDVPRRKESRHPPGIAGSRQWSRRVPGEALAVTLRQQLS